MPTKSRGAQADRELPRSQGRTLSDLMRDDEGDPMPTTPPPSVPPAPKRKMTRDEIKAQMDRAGQKVPKKFAKGGSVGSASRRADGIAKKGKTKGKFV